MKYILLILLCLTGCTHIEPKQEFVFIKAAPIPELIIQPPEWEVANQQQLKQLSNDPSKKDSVWFILSQDKFNELMQTINRIGQKLEKQSEVIIYYEDSIDRYEDKEPD